jgi:protein-L-isoaspartate(D-aspartate) O-methyltransferase
MDTIEKYQRQLLEQCRFMHRRRPLSDATAQAYLATPRHEFVKRYREWGTRAWHDVHDGNLAEHAGALYANRPLVLFGDDDDDIPSTISQPALVLRMLDLLQLQPGHRVFELGTGSGWNAALIGHLVGGQGQVHSLEIIPEVAATAQATMAARGITNVHIIAGDGGDGFAPAAPYDRAVFTAGTYDLPRHFYSQLTDGGLLLVVIKSEGGGDNLFLLRKSGDHFESLESMICGFVQLRGKYQIDSLDPKPLEALSEWPTLADKEVERTPFWWGGKGAELFMWHTSGARSFLGIVEPAFRAFKSAAKLEGRAQDEQSFGLWQKDRNSLALCKDDQIIAYGNASAKDRLIERLHEWVDLGMPSAASFSLRIYPSDMTLTNRAHQWIVKRPESQFVWSLDG